VILEPADYLRWLGEEVTSSDELRALLRPYPAGPMLVYSIGQRIGNVKNDDTTLIEPIRADRDGRSRVRRR